VTFKAPPSFHARKQAHCDKGISRNTVVLAYDRLVYNGYLFVKARSGYFVDSRFESGTSSI